MFQAELEGKWREEKGKLEKVAMLREGHPVARGVIPGSLIVYFVSYVAAALATGFFPFRKQI